MRVLFLVLVLLNLLALASARGWLGTSPPQGEPERLSNQLNPERIVLRTDESGMADTSRAPLQQLTGDTQPTAGESTPLITGQEAAAAEPSAPVIDESCIAYGGLTEPQAETLVQTALAGRSELRHERKTSTTPSAWWVRIPPGGGREGAERRVAELRMLGIDDLFIVQEPGPNQFAVSLGLFKTEAKAQQHLAYLQGKRVRTASVTARSTTVHRIEVRGPANNLDNLSRSRAVRQSGASIGECTP
jgi:hypothetical protein